LEKRNLFAPGLALVGLHPENVIYAKHTGHTTVVLLMEERLHHSSLGGVMGGVAEAKRTARSRAA
jgi:protein ImuA